MAKRPRDLNQLAKLAVDIASGEAEDTVSEKMRFFGYPTREGWWYKWRQSDGGSVIR